MFVDARASRETGLNDADGLTQPLWRTVGESHGQVKRMALDGYGCFAQAVIGKAPATDQAQPVLDELT